jgi:ribosomal protein S18 acetylase RimI-like enzyme
MADAMTHPLDKLIWTVLTTRQAHLSEGDARARRFQTDIGPFAAAVDSSEASVAALASVIPADGDISLLEPSSPAPPSGVDIPFTAPGVQMITRAFTKAPRQDLSIEALSDADAEEMLALALLTRPGPFRKRTHTLGRFIGIRDNGKLIAMAGERLQTEEFIEISGVCTHPDYRSRGYGAALLTTVGQRILDEGKTPFLHAYASNTGAIALYRSLGFEHRRDVTHAVWKRSPTAAAATAATSA